MAICRQACPCPEASVSYCDEYESCSVTKRNLILIHRGPEYVEDFEEIAAKVESLDRDITVYYAAHRAKVRLPATAWAHPTLTVSLVDNFLLPVERGPILRNRMVEKLDQQDIFRKGGIPTPPAALFHFGMKLDPILFGEFVILKPADLKLTSSGASVQLFRRRRAEQLTLADFPPDHLIHRDRKGYLVQRFVDTGEKISAYRVTTYFGVPIMSAHMRSNVPRPPLHSSDAELETTPVASNAIKDKMRYLHADPDMVELARRVHALFPDTPLLGTDVLREAATGRLFVLECNSGGNTWHFSSKSGENLRGWFGGHPRVPLEKAARKGRQMYIAQYGAFDRVAEVLRDKVHQLAG